MVIVIVSEMYWGFSIGEDFFYLEGLYRVFFVCWEWFYCVVGF